jgi:hypothetical protein
MAMEDISMIIVRIAAIIIPTSKVVAVAKIISNESLKEMNKLYQLAGDHLKEVSIMITHMKPCENCETTIKEEIQKSNILGLKLYFPKQGELIQQ